MSDKENSLIVDLDRDPFAPEGLTVESHQKGGQFDLTDISELPLYLSKKQKEGQGLIAGSDLWEELKSKKVLNANALDYLLAHQNVIPYLWRFKYVFFWGTIYCNSDGLLCVRFLIWCGSMWSWNHRLLDSFLDPCEPAALASF